MDRFACDWHRLAGPPTREGRTVRRNHGPGRVPYRNASPWGCQGTPQSHGAQWRRRQRRRRPRRPADRSARAASASVAPVVTTSSTTSTRQPRTDAASRGGTCIAPARFAARSRRSRPAWSLVAAAERSTAATRAVPAGPAQRRRGTAGEPARGVVAPLSDGARARRGRHQPQRPRLVARRSRDRAGEGVGQRPPGRPAPAFLVRHDGRAHRAVVGSHRPGRQAGRAGRGPAGCGAAARLGRGSRRGTRTCPRLHSRRRSPAARGRARHATGSVHTGPGWQRRSWPPRPATVPVHDGGRWTTPTPAGRSTVRAQPGYAGSEPTPSAVQPPPEVNCNSCPSAVPATSGLPRGGTAVRVTSSGCGSMSSTV